jgi:hypothetical protein
MRLLSLGCPMPPVFSVALTYVSQTRYSAAASAATSLAPN